MANYRWLTLKKPITKEQLTEELDHINCHYFCASNDIKMWEDGNDYCWLIKFEDGEHLNFAVWLDKATMRKIYYHVNVGGIMKGVLEEFHAMLFKARFGGRYGAER